MALQNLFGCLYKKNYSESLIINFNIFFSQTKFHFMKETKELLKLGIEVQKAISDALEDGKVNLLDLGEFIPVISSAGKAIDGIGKVKAELAAMTPEQKQELKDYVAKEFDLDNDKIELLIEDTINTVLELYELTKRWASYRKA